MTLPEGGPGRSSQAYPKKYPGWDVWEGLPDLDALEKSYFPISTALAIEKPPNS